MAAFAEDRVVAVEDLQSERVWDQIAAVVGQLQVRGVLSVPVRLASQPVGTLDVYVTQPRAWTTGEVEALGALAVVTAELVSTGWSWPTGRLRWPSCGGPWPVGSGSSRPGVWPSPGVGPDQAFQQLRRRARSSSRKLADLAQEVVQEAQRERSRPGGR